jgi:hypothetical protein
MKKFRLLWEKQEKSQKFLEIRFIEGQILIFRITFLDSSQTNKSVLNINFNDGLI